MKLLERTFELRGPEGLGARPRPELIGPVLGRVHDTLLETVRMGFLHSSRARGRIPGCLQRAAPAARRVRLCGRLDLLGVSKRVMGLFLEGGVSVTAVWMEEGFVDLASFLDKKVLIEGLAEFRPSGALLRVDADAIRDAGTSDASFSTLPLAEIRRNYQKAAATVRPGQKPYASIFGLIPGEESDDEFAAAVEELS